jgi:hypothetical protein
VSRRLRGAAPILGNSNPDPPLRGRSESPDPIPDKITWTDYKTLCEDADEASLRGVARGAIGPSAAPLTVAKVRAALLRFGKNDTRRRNIVAHNMNNWVELDPAQEEEEASASSEEEEKLHVVPRKTKDVEAKSGQKIKVSPASFKAKMMALDDKMLRKWATLVGTRSDEDVSRKSIRYVRHVQPLLGPFSRRGAAELPRHSGRASQALCCVPRRLRQ